MELLPILSTIILVGTIATLILAVAAYVLYKIRERNGRRVAAAQAQTRPATPHVLTQPALALPPAPHHAFPQPELPALPAALQPVQAATYVPPQHVQLPQAPPPARSVFWEYTSEGYVPAEVAEAPETASADWISADWTSAGRITAEHAPAEHPSSDGIAWL